MDSLRAMSLLPFVPCGRELFTVTAFLCASLGLGCAGHPIQPSQLPLGQPFELRPGASAILQDGLKVTFDEVSADSRCPMGVLCVWAGDAIVRVRLAPPVGSHVERELHTQLDGSETSYLAYAIKLVALAPYPRSDRRIPPNDYAATLIVETR